MAKVKFNKVTVKGTLAEVDTKISTTAAGKKYIGGKIVVRVVQDGVENLIDMKIFAFEMTKANTVSKLFTAYTKLEGMLNKRVAVEGEFREDKMVDQGSGSIRAFNTISAKFINELRGDEPDCATFEFNGFVVKELYERRNKEDELYGYRIEVGQSNYNDTMLQVLRFDVDKNDVNIATAIQSNYLTGLTVTFYGTLSQITRTEVKVEETAFGDPVTETKVYTDRAYRIRSGNQPLEEGDPNAYTMDEINTFIEAYKKDNEDRIEKAKNGGEEAVSETPATSPTAAAMNRMTRMQSLI